MDVDIGKAPEPHQLSPASDPPPIPTLDGWIESLMSCKQLAESDVVRLCDKVCCVDLHCIGYGRFNTLEYPPLTELVHRLEKSYKKSPTSSLW